jgi:2-keto-3-deoxy-L-fuconate dehydrogenase
LIDLTHKKVLVTAAAQGIGRASVLAFAKAGARVWATDINEKGLEDLAADNVRTRRLDATNRAEFQAVVAEIGVVDVLFNCAGVVHTDTVLTMTDATLDFALDLNLRAQVIGIQTVLPGMLAQKDGSIINMATVASSVMGVPNRCAYSVSKAAVIGLTKSVAADFIGQGIRVNAICPGTVATPSLVERWEATGDVEKAREAFTARQPMGRLAEPEELADLAVYLAGATFTTGQIHVADGGMSL